MTRLVVPTTNPASRRSDWRIDGPGDDTPRSQCARRDLRVERRVVRTHVRLVLEPQVVLLTHRRAVVGQVRVAERAEVARHGREAELHHAAQRRCVVGGGDKDGGGTKDYRSATWRWRGLTLTLTRGRG